MVTDTDAQALRLRAEFYTYFRVLVDGKVKRQPVTKWLPVMGWLKGRPKLLIVDNDLFDTVLFGSSAIGECGELSRWQRLRQWLRN